VFYQTYPNIEYIIIDGSSTDDTVDIIKEYEGRFNGRMHYISESDKGIYDAMNKGIKLATGGIIGILNSDDLFCDEYAIERVMDVFETDKSIDAVYSDLIFVAKNDTLKVERKWIIGEQKSFVRGWHPAHPTFFVKRKIYEEYGLFNLKYNLAADFELMLRFIEKNRIRIYYLRLFLVRMRLGGASTKGLKNVYIQNIECLDAFRINEIKVNLFFYPIVRLIPKLFQYTN